MSLRDSLLRIAGNSEHAVERVLDSSEFVLLATTWTASFADRAFAAGDLSIAAALKRRSLGLVPPGDLVSRLEIAFTQIDQGLVQDTTVAEKYRRLGRPEDEIEDLVRDVRRTRALRLARAEPLNAGRAAQRLAMLRHDVSGWTRQTGPKPCAACESLADGTVLSPETTMFDHPGCSCVAVPVTE